METHEIILWSAFLLFGTVSTFRTIKRDKRKKQEEICRLWEDFLRMSNTYFEKELRLDRFSDYELVEQMKNHLSTKLGYLISITRNLPDSIKINDKRTADFDQLVLELLEASCLAYKKNPKDIEEIKNDFFETLEANLKKLNNK